jgi:hypothetical protein
MSVSNLSIIHSDPVRVPQRNVAVEFLHPGDALVDPGHASRARAGTLTRSRILIRHGAEGDRRQHDDEHEDCVSD